MSDRGPILIDRGTDPPVPPLKPSRPVRRVLVVFAVAAVVGAILWVANDLSSAPSADTPMVRIARPTVDTLGVDEPIGDFLARRHIDTARVFKALAAARVNPDALPLASRITTMREVATDVVSMVAFLSDDDHRVSLRRGRDGSWTAKVEPMAWTSRLQILEGRFGSDLSVGLDTVQSASIGSALGEAFSAQLSEILAWQVYVPRRIIAGDRFRAVVTVQQASDGQQRIREVRAIELGLRDRGLTAYRFSSSASAPFAFFDDQGRALGRPFMRAPLATGGATSSPYLENRVHPVLGTVRAHRGVDFPAPEGTAIVAAAAGLVRVATTGNDLGNYIEINHGSGVTTRYGHMSRFADGIADGAAVRRAQVIGYVGHTGLATAPHLHYEFRVHGEPIDMRLLDIDPERPVDPIFRPAFETERQRMRALLKQPAERAPSVSGQP